MTPIISPITATLAVMLVALFALSLLVQRIRSRRKTIPGSVKPLPGPTGWPLIGCAPTLAKYAKPWEAFSELRKVYGDVFGMYLGSQHCLVVSSFDAIKEVLVQKSADFANRPNFARFSAIFRGQRDLSVALCDWSEKQRRRREITFPFTHPKTHTMRQESMEESILTELQDFLVPELRKLSQSSVVNVHEPLLIATANIFYSFLCSRRYDSNDQRFLRTIHTYHGIFCDLFRGYPIDFFPWIRFFNNHVLNDLVALSEEVSRFTEPIMHEHKQNLDPTNPKDLVDLLLLSSCPNNEAPSKERPLTEHDSQVIIEDLIGGHSALFNMFLWTLALVAKHPEVREGIQREVDEVTNNGAYSVSLKDRAQLPYTEATVLEVLRVVTSPIIPHRTTKDTTVQGHYVQENTLVFFNTYDMYMDPSLWKEPRKFAPERFISSEGKVSKPEYFIPFGTGRRSCLGDGLVKATLILGLATLLQNFDMQLTPDSQMPDLYQLPCLVLWPNDIFFSFKSREKRAA